MTVYKVIGIIMVFRIIEIIILHILEITRKK